MPKQKHNWKRKLKQARKGLGHSQEEAARRMGVSWATVQRWEKGKQMPTGVCAERLQQYIAMSRELKEVG